MKSKKIELQELDLAELLDSKEKMIAYLNAELAEGDPHYIKVALKAIARACNISEIAKEDGITRSSIIRSLSNKGNPRYFTIHKILKALDMNMMVVPRARVNNEK